MLYELIRPMANVVFRSLLRKINIINADKFPKDVPVVLACNHPTAFLEPCILACFIDRPLYFIVRGDFFKNPIFRRLMFGVHLIPIHRIEGGISNIKKNHEIFQYCYDCLDANNTILIMAEGTTRQHKRLGPLKKGTGRIALGFQDAKERDDALLVPVGVNFTKADDWRTDVSIKVGNPLSLSKYNEKYDEHPNIAYQELNNDIHSSLRENMIFIADEEDDEPVEFLLHFERIHFVDSWWRHARENKALFERLQKIADQFNALDDESDLKERLLKLMTGLKSKGVKYEHLDLELGNVGFHIFLLLVLSPLFIVGFLVNAVSYGFAFWFARKKVRQLEFEHPVRASVVLGINMILWPLLVIIALMSGSWILTAVYLFKLVLGFFAFKYYDRVLVVREYMKFKKLDKSWRESFIKELQSIRKTILGSSI